MQVVETLHQTAGNSTKPERYKDQSFGDQITGVLGLGLEPVKLLNQSRRIFQSISAPVGDLTIQVQLCLVNDKSSAPSASCSHLQKGN